MQPDIFLVELFYPCEISTSIRQKWNV